MFYRDQFTVVDCVFVGNMGSWGAGAISTHTNEGVLINCRFVGNASEGTGEYYGGGALSLYNPAGMSLINCTFTGNSSGYGGAILSSPNSGAYGSTLTNCTFSGNSATAAGGGLYIHHGSPTLADCILWENTDADGSDETAQFHIGSGQPRISYSCVQGWTGDFGGEGNIGDDPLFWDADGEDDVFGTEDDNLRLRPGSPCIDAADNTAVPADDLDLDGDDDTEEPIPFDIDGNPRFVDDPDTDDTGNGEAPIVDMGAYEFQACPGDIDGDGDTDHSDLGELLRAWGARPGDPNWNENADLDSDGEVGHGDLAIFFTGWGCGT